MTNKDQAAKKIPKFIEKKLLQIQKAENRKNKLLMDVLDWEPKLETYTFIPENWQWVMFFSGTESQVNVITMKQMMLEAINSQELS